MASVDLYPPFWMSCYGHGSAWLLDKWLHPLIWVLIAILMAIPVASHLNLPGLLTDRGTTDRVLHGHARWERAVSHGGAAPYEYWPLTVKRPDRSEVPR
jgi:hypothetical protein